MKIKINNIFKDMNLNNKLKNNDNEYIKTRRKRQEDKEINYVEINSMINNVEEKYSDQDIEEIVIDNIDKLEPKIKRRRNTSFNKDESKIKKENKILIYLSNLFKNRNNLARGYYLLFIGMLVLGGGSVYLAAKTYNLFESEDYTIYDTAQSSIEDTPVFSNSDNSVNKDVIEQESITSNIDTKENVNNTNSNQNTKKNTNTNSGKTNTVTVAPLSFSKPIEGEILKIYSIDKVIYSKTLELWKTHDGIDIKASIGDKVKSIEKGVVEKVYDDAFYGVTIVIDHGQGYKSSYSNLDKSVSVKEKETITKGKVIGKISNTAIGEIKDDPHLHFTLIKDNEIVDPSYIFN